MSGLSRLFKPWRWHKKKKTSEKLEKRAADLERKISERSSREDLIKRGILKERDENLQQNEKNRLRKPIIDSAVESEWSLPPAVIEDDAAIDLSFETTAPSVSQAAVENNKLPSSSSSSEAMAASVSEVIVPIQHSNHVKIQDLAELNHVVPPRDNAHCSDNQLHRIPVVPYQVKEEPIAETENSSKLSATSVVIPVNAELSMEPGEPSQTIPLRSAENVTIFYIPPPPPADAYDAATESVETTGNEGYEQIYAHEPDLSKRPYRSALKGGKTKELFQRELEERFSQRIAFATDNRGNSLPHGTGPNYDSFKKMPPKVAPKPGHLVNRHSDPCNKENICNETQSHNTASVQKSEDDTTSKTEQEANIRRRDSLSRFLLQRPQKNELIERNIIPLKSEEDRIEDRQMIGTKLNRRLSLRPTFEDLEAKHILLKLTPEELEKEKEEKKKILIRKLSFRPTIDELKDRKIIKFNDYIEVTEAEEYDRKGDKPWTRLTPRDKAAIRKELNEFKSTEMDVHEESKHMTRFHRP